ncbi:MAG TPA: YhjD/YihY/BrkB family envelope integrity protein [Verrucomicrobiae bacterium]
MASKRFFRLIKIITGAVAGAEDEIFHLEGRLERFVHFWALVGKSFNRNRCPARAAALSYATLLALIPMLAVAISVTSSLLKSEGEGKIYEVIDKVVSNVMPPPATLNTTNVSLEIGPDFSGALKPTNSVSAGAFTNAVMGTNEVAATAMNSFVAAGDDDSRVIDAQKQVAKGIHEFIQNTRSKTLGLIGMLLLIYVAITMLANIEGTFNDIWGVTRGRNWLLRIVLYWATITLGPLLLIVALGLSGGAQMQAAREFVSQTPFVGGLIFKLLPLVVLWLAFALFYQIVPNTKVDSSAALVGGFVAGSLWHLNNVFGFLYVSRVVSNSQIYGKLGLVPVFMAGLYFSWLILLFGAQVAYAFQNRAAYLQDRLADNVNQRGREFVALRIMTSLGQRFQNGRHPATVLQLSAELGIPSRLTQSVLHVLAHMGLVTEVAGIEAAFVPARPLENINAYDILLAMRTGSGQELPLREEPALAEIYGEFTRIEKAERETASAISMLALVNRTPPPPALAESKVIRAEKKPAAATPVEKISAPEKIDEVEEKIQSPEPLAAPAEASAPRREVVRPGESEFPL